MLVRFVRLFKAVKPKLECTYYHFKVSPPSSAPSFHLPDDKFLPVIMIGPGTGIAPFRAFWQQRFYEIQNGTMKEDLGPIELYFGCRTSKLDFIYKDELQEMSEGGVLDGLHTAFSREPGQPKVCISILLLGDGPT